MYIGRTPYEDNDRDQDYVCICQGIQVAVVIKNLPASARDIRDIALIPGL